MKRLGWLAVYMAAIIAANWMTATYGLVPVGFGLKVTAGTFAAGAVLLVRDRLQLVANRWWVLGAIIGAELLIRQAQTHGVRVHVGRVNSGTRFRHFDALGCDTADGTYLAFGPEKNAPKLFGWMNTPRQEFLA